MGRSKSRADQYTAPVVQAVAECVDCDTQFPITLYPNTETGEQYVRDHPDNGCHVKLRKTVRTSITPKEPK